MKKPVTWVLEGIMHHRTVHAALLAASFGVGASLLSGSMGLAAEEWQGHHPEHHSNHHAYHHPVLEAVPEYAGNTARIQPETFAELAQELFERRNSYIGDAAANGALIETLSGYLPKTPITQEIFTEEIPYCLKLCLEEGPDQTDPISVYQYDNLDKIAAVLLSVIENADEIAFSYPCDGGAENYCEYYDAEQIADCYDGLQVKEYGNSADELQELFVKLDWRLYLDEEGNPKLFSGDAETTGNYQIETDDESVAIIGGADGPTSIFLAGKLDGNTEGEDTETQDIGKDVKTQDTGKGDTKAQDTGEEGDGK